MREQIISILQELRPEFDFTENLNFIEEGLLDSLDMINLVQSLDETFNISLDGSDILPQNFSSIASIEKLLEKYGVK